MNHRGKLVFILVCGLIGSALSLWLLPPVVNDIGLQIFSKMRTDDLKAVADASKSHVARPKPVDKTPNSEVVKDEQPAVDGGKTEDSTTTDPALGDSGKEPVSNDPAKPTEEIPPVKKDGATSTAIERASKQTVGVEEAVEETKFPTNPYAIALFGLIVGLAIGSFLMRQGEMIATRWEKSPSGDKLTIMLGSLAGVIAGILVSMPFLIALQGRPEGALLTIGMVVGCSAAMIYLLRALGPYLPWETTAMSRRTGLKILDTNVLIDGRVYDLIRTGFLDGDLYVPQFVLLELQHIADSADGLRRQRGRRGLEVLNRIRSEFEVEVGNRDRYAGNEKDEVDTRLMKLCKALGADLVSNDFNLNRTASVQDIHVLNINDLALALRPNVLPGEFLEVQVMKEGNQTAQGVGYLDDGTMVVVEGGAPLIGLGPKDVTVTQVIQTERGKMIFANADPDAPLEDSTNRRRSPRGQR
jgi:uncharacterized protein YacL